MWTGMCVMKGEHKTFFLTNKRTLKLEKGSLLQEKACVMTFIVIVDSLITEFICRTPVCAVLFEQVGLLFEIQTFLLIAFATLLQICKSCLPKVQIWKFS